MKFWSISIRQFGEKSATSGSNSSDETNSGEQVEESFDSGNFLRCEGNSWKRRQSARKPMQGGSQQRDSSLHVRVKNENFTFTLAISKV